MLVLSRRIGESIVIGRSISVTVIQVRVRAVSLGIDAPKDVGVRRSELCERSQLFKPPSPSAPGATLLR